MADEPTDRRLDGNAVAGELQALIAAELTEALRSCPACPTSAPLAEHHAYLDAPGAVLRCPGCGIVALRVVRTPGRILLDLTGTHVLQVPAPQSPG